MFALMDFLELMNFMCYLYIFVWFIFTCIYIYNNLYLSRAYNYWEFNTSVFVCVIPLVRFRYVTSIYPKNILRRPSVKQWCIPSQDSSHLCLPYHPFNILTYYVEGPQKITLTQSGHKYIWQLTQEGSTEHNLVKLFYTWLLRVDTIAKITVYKDMI